jgi:hypothetical protein
MRHPRMSLCLLAVALTLGGIAHAVQPRPAATADLLLPQGPESINRALDAGRTAMPAATQIRLDGAMRDFGRATGAHWYAVSWNPVTLTPRLVAGSGLGLGRPVADAASAERMARAFVARSRELFRVDDASLALWKTPHGMGKWAVHFTQTLDGTPVIGSRLTVLMTDAGRVAAFGGDVWPDLQAPTRALLSEGEALRQAWRAAHERGLAPLAAGPNDRIWSEALGILPASATEGRLVYRVRLALRDPLGAWMFDVDAIDGAIVQMQDVLRAADCTGTATGIIEDPGWCFGSDTLAVDLLNLTIEGVGTTTTLPDGSFSLPWGGSDPVGISADLEGPFVHVDNTQDPDAHFAATLQPGEPFTLFWDDSNSRADERDVFHATNVTHGFMKTLDPSWVDLDFPMPANVNLQQQCNAFWDGSSINFYHEGGNCANTGRMLDVVAHEYTHGISDYLYGPNDPPGDMGEANSDVMGNALTDESRMGRGFYLDDCVNGIRDSDNDLRWPDDLQGEVHWDGQILAGFHWDVRQNMIAAHGYTDGNLGAMRIWHYARLLGQPQTQPEQAWWAFLADDDDGDLDNGTPNHASLWPAAEHHGFAYPEAFENVVIHHAGLLHAPALPGQPIEIKAVIYSFAGAMNPDSMLVYYRIAGDPEFTPVVMTPTGQTDAYHGLLPNLPVGTVIDYYILAADALQNRLCAPRNAPLEFYEADVVTIYDPFEEEAGWTVGAPSDNATQGIWERCDPFGTTGGSGVPLQPENDTTPGAGVNCFITGQYNGGPVDGSDADGRTTLLSPIYDLTGAASVRVRANVWFQSFGYPPTGANLNVDVSSNGMIWFNIYHREGMDMTPEWEPMDVDITHFFPTIGQLRVRVVMNGRTGYTVDEGGFDDFLVIAQTSSPVPPEPGPVTGGALRLSLASGNPATGLAPAQVRFELPRAATVRLRVCDASGRVVRTLVDGTREAGVHDLAWDGRDDAGRRVGSGVYLMRLVTPQGSRTQRVVWAR